MAQPQDESRAALHDSAVRRSDAPAHGAGSVGVLLSAPAPWAYCYRRRLRGRTATTHEACNRTPVANSPSTRNSYRQRSMMRDRTRAATHRHARERHAPPHALLVHALDGDAVRRHGRLPRPRGVALALDAELHLFAAARRESWMLARWRYSIGGRLRAAAGESRRPRRRNSTRERVPARTSATVSWTAATTTPHLAHQRRAQRPREFIAAAVHGGQPFAAGACGDGVRRATCECGSSCTRGSGTRARCGDRGARAGQRFRTQCDVPCTGVTGALARAAGSFATARPPPASEDQRQRAHPRRRRTVRHLLHAKDGTNRDDIRRGHLITRLDAWATDGRVSRRAARARSLSALGPPHVGAVDGARRKCGGATDGVWRGRNKITRTEGCVCLDQPAAADLRNSAS